MTNEQTEQSWHFTFGNGVKHPVTSIDLSEHYVTIKGTYESARAEMLARFGTAWCDQYEAYTDGSQWIPEELTELDRIEWPALPDPGPDYWERLADGMVQAAEKLRTLAGTPAPKSYRPAVWVGGSFSKLDTDLYVSIVDRIAEVFAATTEDERSPGGHWEHKVKAKADVLTIHAYARIPEPEDPEKAAMRAEFEALRAQLGGTR